MRTFAFLVLLSAGLLLGPRACRADVKPAALFSDGMVLQQGRPIPVWGTASPGEAVTVSLQTGGQTAAADSIAGADGAWKVTLPAQRATEQPGTLTITGKSGAATIHNLVIGEVWLCSGQSNMSFTVSGVENAASEIAAANDPMIRQFTVAPNSAFAPQTDVAGSWAAASPQTAGNFTAVSYFFARRLRAELHEPVGIIDSAMGGTRIEPWIPFDAISALPAFRYRATVYQKQAELALTDKAAYEKQRADAQADYPNIRAAWYKQLDMEDPGLNLRWFQPQTDVSAWYSATLPGAYGNNPLGAYLGSLWCRKDVVIPDAWVGKDLEIHLGAIDEADDTYVNGRHVGRTWFETPDYWKAPRIYTIPASAVTSTNLSVVVRILNLYGDVGMFGPADDMKVFPKGDTASTPVPLTGVWRYQFGLYLDGSDIPQPAGDPPGGSGADPSGLYNAMIGPLVPYGIRGVVWYQGESNADMASEYRLLLTCLITSWRKAWGEGDFPFAYVQLPNYLTLQRLPAEKGSWADIREAQRLTLSVPNTTMAITLDLGEPWNLHPPDKQDVGARLAGGVLATVYGRHIPLYSGPLYQSMKVDGDKIDLRFTFADGLHGRYGPLTGFAIAGADKVFHVAVATIEKGTVVVSSPAVPVPIAVRYGWAMNPVGNLVNAANLPASSFRTDNWGPTEWTPANELVTQVGVVSRRGGG